MVGNTFMPIRTLFAWSFDRLLPERLSDVNERTHSPVLAIADRDGDHHVDAHLEHHQRRTSSPG